MRLLSVSCWCRSPEALGIVSGLVYVAALVTIILTIVDNPDVKVGFFPLVGIHTT